MQHQERNLYQEASLYYYLKTILQNGKRSWFVVKSYDYVRLTLLEGLIRNNKPYNIRDYANVLFAGEEDYAPKAVLDYVNRIHGTNFSD
jgi:hypothetical protein